MNNTEKRSTGQVLRSRGVGTLVGALIGFCWMSYGLVHLPKSISIPLAVTGVAICFIIIRYAVRFFETSKTMPAPGTSAIRRNRKVKALFWINFLVEIILLNVVFQLLAKYALNEYIIPAISVIVGAHFVPMAFFMNIRQYFFCALALIACAMIAILLMKLKVASSDWIAAVEAVANALILWATAVIRIRKTIVPAGR